jgi:hypothetical protein
MMQSVQVIIERLKTHPEDFFGEINEKRALGVTYPKFHELRDKLDNLLTDPQDGNIYRLWYLNEDEKLALLEAYKEARRARFEAKVFHTLLTAPTAVDLAVERMDTSGKRLMQGSQEPNKMVVPKNMLVAATKILSDEFDKAYAKNRGTL